MDAAEPTRARADDRNLVIAICVSRNHRSERDICGEDCGEDDGAVFRCIGTRVEPLSNSTTLGYNRTTMKRDTRTRTPSEQRAAP